MIGAGASGTGGARGTASASIAGHGVNLRPFDGLINAVGNYMSNAHKLAMMADKFDKDMEMLSQRQGGDISNKKEYYDYVRSYGKDKGSKSYDLDDFYKAAYNRTIKDLS